MRVSFVIPCYDEAAALDAGLDELVALPGDEIVFVDDGSRDGTAARLEAARRADPRVRVVTHPTNRGVGAAMRSGFAAATGEIVVAYDADRTYPATDAARLIRQVVAGADVATATPFGEGAALRTTLWRGALSRGASLAYRLAVGSRARGVRTFTAGFRAYRRDRLASAPFRSDGFSSTAEILCRLLLSGAKVVEVPSTLSVRTEGVSKMRVGRTIVGHLRVLAHVLDARLGRRMTSP